MNPKKLLRNQKQVTHLLFERVLGKKYQTEIASTSPKFSNTSLLVEITKQEERFFKSDINPFVSQHIYGKYSTSLRHIIHSTLIRRTNFRFQVFFFCNT